MRKSFALSICLALASTVSYGAGSPTWKPDPKLIAKLEALIKIPGEAGYTPIPLSKYARYYAGVTVNGRRMIRGELVLDDPDGKVLGIFVVPEAKFPPVADGGCDIVNLQYDVATARIVWI